MPARELALLGVVIGLIIMAVHLITVRFDRLEDRLGEAEKAQIVHRIGHPERRHH